jgi:hypothetical protein
MSHYEEHVPTKGHSAVLTSGVLLALVAAAVGVLFGVVNIAVYAFSPEFAFTVDVVASQPTTLEGSSSVEVAEYSAVEVAIIEGADGARGALTVSLLAQYGLFVVACIAAAVAFWNLRLGRSFSAISTGLLATLGAAVSVTAIAAPWFKALSTRLAIAAAGLPVSPDETADWVLEPGSGVDRDAILLCAVGIALLVAAIYFRIGNRIRQELSEVI